MPDVTVDVRGARGPGIAELARGSGIAPPDATNEEAIIAVTRAAVEELIQDGNTDLAVVSDFGKDVIATADSEALLELLGLPQLFLETLGAVGDGTTDDTAAIQAAMAVPNRIVQGTPGKTYLVTARIDGAANTHLWNATLKLKTGSGGFTSVETTTDRYTNVALRWDNVDGGGWNNVEIYGDGVTEVSVTPVIVRQGMTTKPLVGLGRLTVRNVPGVNAGMILLGLGAAGARIHKLRFKDIGTNTKEGPGGLWLRGGVLETVPANYINPTGLSIDGDGTTYGYSGFIDIDEIEGENIFMGGAAYAKNGGQTDCVTLAGTGLSTGGGRIGRIVCNGVDEVLDIQASNWTIGSVEGRNVRFVVAKFIHGAQYNEIGEVRGSVVGRALTYFSGNSANAVDTAYNMVRATTGKGVGDYILDSGTLQAGSTTTATLRAGASSVTNEYSAGSYGGVIIITGGTGAGQERTFSAYNGATKVISGLSANFSPAPNNTSTYKIIPFAERTAVAFEGEGAPGFGIVRENDARGIAVTVSGQLDYLVRANLTTATSNNRAEIASDTGVAKRTVNVGVSGSVRVSQAFRSICRLGMSGTQTAPSLTTDTLIQFDTVRDASYVVGGGNVEQEVSNRGIRVRNPGPKKGNIQLRAGATVTAGATCRIIVKRDATTVAMFDYIWPHASAWHMPAWPFEFYHDETSFGTGNENLYRAYVHQIGTAVSLDYNSLLVHFSIAA